MGSGYWRLPFSPTLSVAKYGLVGYILSEVLPCICEFCRLASPARNERRIEMRTLINKKTHRVSNTRTRWNNATRAPQTIPYIEHSAIYHFCTGMDSLFDIQGGHYNFMIKPILTTDNNSALRSDWQAVGDDMRKAMDSFSHKH